MGETEMSARIAVQREPLTDGGTPPVIDAAFARWLADRAGQVLLGVREEMGYSDGKALKAAGDKAAHDLLRAELARWRPADAVLSEEDDHSRLAWQDEEQAVRPERLGASRVWIIDPLDGTREFSEEGRTDWAVHVALWTAECHSPNCLAAGLTTLTLRRRPLPSGPLGSGAGCRRGPGTARRSPTGTRGCPRRTRCRGPAAPRTSCGCRRSRS